MTIYSAISSLSPILGTSMGLMLSTVGGLAVIVGTIFALAFIMSREDA